MMGLNQIEVVSDIMQVLIKHGYNESGIELGNACIGAANLLCDAVDEYEAKVAERAKASGADGPRGIEWWLQNGYRGTSSDNIHKAIGLRNRVSNTSGHPYDIGDFWRCEMLLREVPEYRNCLAMMSQYGPVWHSFVRNWQRIVGLAEEAAPGCFSYAQSSGLLNSEASAMVRKCRVTPNWDIVEGANG